VTSNNTVAILELPDLPLAPLNFDLPKLTFSADTNVRSVDSVGEENMVRLSSS
jgi:hypothetical protein